MEKNNWPTVNSKNELQKVDEDAERTYANFRELSLEGKLKVLVFMNALYNAEKNHDKKTIDRLAKLCRSDRF